MGGPIRTSYIRTAHGAGVWVDSSRTALRRLGLNGSATAHYLIRPDGYIGYRARAAQTSKGSAHICVRCNKSSAEFP